MKTTINNDINDLLQDNNVSTNVPPLTSVEEVKAHNAQSTVRNPFRPQERINLNEYREKLANSLVTSETLPPPEKPIIAIDDHGIFTKSDIHLVKAKAKSGKTTMLKIIVAAILSGQQFRIKSLLENPKIVWVDTEQSMNDTYGIIRDVIKLSGMSPQEVNERLKVYHLRRFFCDELKASLVTALIDNCPDVVIIDGVVDMVESFNDERESKLFVRILLALSEEFDCSIIQVLHTNKASEDHNPRGHLGTNETNASETVLECEKKGEIFTVKCTESRHSGMPEWHFMYDANGNIINADNQYIQAKNQEKEKEDSLKVGNEYLKVAQSIIAEVGPINRTELSEKMSAKTGKSKPWMATQITSLNGNGLFIADEIVYLKKPEPAG
ncbi:MAG: AAA family ATPase [Bacteroidaceae bacterium]|nr:AAA family ATPase [Bacteroidaceae bacterium]